MISFLCISCWCFAFFLFYYIIFPSLLYSVLRQKKNTVNFKRLIWRSWIRLVFVRIYISHAHKKHLYIYIFLYVSISLRAAFVIQLVTGVCFCCCCSSSVVNKQINCDSNSVNFQKRSAREKAFSTKSKERNLLFSWIHAAAKTRPMCHDSFNRCEGVNWKTKIHL